MTNNMQVFSLTVEPEFFNQVLERVDVLAIKQNSNRSAIIRQALYDCFEVKVTTKTNNYAKIIKKRRMEQ